MTYHIKWIHRGQAWIEADSQEVAMGRLLNAIAILGVPPTREAPLGPDDECISNGCEAEAVEVEP